MNTINKTDKHFVRYLIDYTTDDNSTMDMFQKSVEDVLNVSTYENIEYIKIAINGYHDILIDLNQCTTSDESARAYYKQYKIKSCTDANDANYGSIYAARITSCYGKETTIRLFYKPVYDYYNSMIDWKISTVIKSPLFITLINNIDISDTTLVWNIPVYDKNIYMNRNHLPIYNFLKSIILNILQIIVL